MMRFAANVIERANRILSCLSLDGEEVIQRVWHRVLVVVIFGLVFTITGNYRNRVLNPLAEKLDLPKLNFQVMRRTMATQAQSMGSVKDIQAHLRHAKADTTANEYMQELPESVKQVVGSVDTMLKKGGESEQVSGDLLPKSQNRLLEVLENMVGTSGFEPLTSTVSR
jgi:hypothetical protein